MAKSAASPFGEGSPPGVISPQQLWLVLLDTTHWLSGDPLFAANLALQSFNEVLASDDFSREFIELAMVSFGPVNVNTGFLPIANFRPPMPLTDGDVTPTQAISIGLDMLDRRMRALRSIGSFYRRPLVFLISDGEENADLRRAAASLRDEENSKKLTFFTVSVPGADAAELAELAKRQPLPLNGIELKRVFTWISSSLEPVPRLADAEENPPPARASSTRSDDDVTRYRVDEFLDTEPLRPIFQALEKPSIPPQAEGLPQRAGSEIQREQANGEPRPKRKAHAPQPLEPRPRLSPDVSYCIRLDTVENRSLESMPEAVANMRQPPLSKLAPQVEQVNLGIAPDTVQFGVSHPAVATRQLAFILKAWVFRRADARAAAQLAKSISSEQTEFVSEGSASLSRGTKVTAKIAISDCIVEPDFQTLFWSGDISQVSFRATPAPGNTEKLQGCCTFSVDGMRVCQIFFDLPFESSRRDGGPFIRGTPVRSAFASYASKDRRQVIARIQGIEKLGVKVFLDAHDLRSNENFTPLLFNSIASSDILYLFWSKHAKRSDWVEREWRYGLENKGREFIDPVPLADPRKVTPPPELAVDKHFMDWTVAYSEYERRLTSWSRFRAWIAGD